MVANLLLPGKAVMRDLRPKVRTDSLRIVAVLLLAEALCGAFSLGSACSGTTGSTQYVHTYSMYSTPMPFYVVARRWRGWFGPSSGLQASG